MNVRDLISLDRLPLACPWPACVACRLPSRHLFLPAFWGALCLLTLVTCGVSSQPHAQGRGAEKHVSGFCFIFRQGVVKFFSSRYTPLR